MHAAHSVVLQLMVSGSSTSVTMSASASQPPGRSSRAISRKTCGLSTARLITPLLMITSKLPSSNGAASM